MNRDYVNATRRARYAHDPRRILDQNRAYREGHRERIALYEAARRLRDRAARLARQLAYQAAHPEVARRNRRAWKARNPDRVRYYVARRRARLAGAAGSHSYKEWRDKVSLFGGCCAYCGEAKPLTIDHKVPLVHGGSDSIENVLPACGRCNSRKGIKTARVFISEGFVVAAEVAA